MLMKTNKNFLVGFKVFFGLLGLSAVVTEMVITIGRGTFRPENFFSYFTIESNIIAGVIFLISAWALFNGRKSGVLDFSRGAATLFMTITGIVFATLLSRLDVQLTAVPWDNTVLHYIIPMAILVDWVLDPPAKAIRFSRAVWWLVYPLIYLAYSLIRGAAVGWYPYPFLDPAIKGYGNVAWVTFVILVFALVISWLLVWIHPSRSDARRRKRAV